MLTMFVSVRYGGRGGGGWGVVRYGVNIFWGSVRYSVDRGAEIRRLHFFLA